LGDKHNNNEGLHLEDDTHVVTLKDKDKVIARWSVTGVTMEEILDTAHLYIKDHHSNLDRRLILFWQQHPRAKFNLEAIAGAIDATKANIKERIKTLAEHGIVEEHHNGGSSPLYSLHCNNQPSDFITQLNELSYNTTWHQLPKFQGEAALA
jgi:DNA-binding MarR family transcriptional regulator